jgi:hypothetical protein
MPGRSLSLLELPGLRERSATRALAQLGVRLLDVGSPARDPCPFSPGSSSGIGSNRDSAKFAVREEVAQIGLGQVVGALNARSAEEPFNGLSSL